MALKSAELAGIPVPERTRQGIIRYLAERFGRASTAAARRIAPANRPPAR